MLRWENGVIKAREYSQTAGVPLSLAMRPRTSCFTPMHLNVLLHKIYIITALASRIVGRIRQVGVCKVFKTPFNNTEQHCS